MNNSELTDLIVEKSLAYLYGDDLNPEPGMGMGYATAVGLAVEEIKKEAERWRRSISISTKMINVCRKRVEKKRREMGR